MPSLRSTLSVLLVLAASAPSCAAEKCELNSDCAAGYCVDGECRQDCRADLDCPKGWTCDAQRGRCDAPPDAAGGAAGSAGSAGSGGTSGADAGGQGGTAGGAGGGAGGAAGSGGAGGGGAGKQELDPCASDLECEAPLVCREWGKGRPERCVRPCSSQGPSATCPAGARCELVSDLHCTLSDVGRPCGTAAECQYACLPAPGYCTSTCASGADCPAGWGCMPVGSPPVDVCVQANAECSSDAARCIVSSACDASLLVSGCTLACDTAADCPVRAAGMAPWTCDGLCRRPADVWGPLPGGWQPSEWYCDGASQPVNLCGDGLHVDFDAFTIPAAPAVDCGAATSTPGVAGDACVDSCRQAGGCPWGFACVGVGSLGADRIGLCLPSLGSGEVGASCVRDSDCAFGYCNRSAGVCSRDCTLDGVCPGGSACVAVGGPGVEGLPFRRCE